MTLTMKSFFALAVLFAVCASAVPGAYACGGKEMKGVAAEIDEAEEHSE